MISTIFISKFQYIKPIAVINWDFFNAKVIWQEKDNLTTVINKKNGKPIDSRIHSKKRFILRHDRSDHSDLMCYYPTTDCLQTYCVPTTRPPVPFPRNALCEDIHMDSSPTLLLAFSHLHDTNSGLHNKYVNPLLHSLTTHRLHQETNFLCVFT